MPTTTDTPQWKTEHVSPPPTKLGYVLPFNQTGQGVGCSKTDRDNEWWCYLSLSGGTFETATDEHAIKLRSLQLAQHRLESALVIVRQAIAELEALDGETKDQ